MGVRRDTYMRTDTEGDNHQAQARSRRAAEGPAPLDEAKMGGYEGVALRGHRRPHLPAARRGDRQHPQRLEPCPSWSRTTWWRCRPSSTAAASQPLAAGELPRSARGLVTQVKEYERTLVEAAVTGDAGLAELALSLHPLVPGISVARELLAEYRRRHGAHLAYLR